MKINLEVDCTPEEARRAVGLPDLTPVHDRYVELILGAMQGHVRPELIDGMIQGWAPMGEAGTAFWRRLFELGASGGNAKVDR